jgi:hypothetical protein
MEVDHYDPTIKNKKRNAYKNLYPAVSQCNNYKRARWPAKKQLEQRLRFLDPCKETDYDNHIFEHQPTGVLLPVSPEAVYHVENCNLNSAWLSQKRRMRTANRDAVVAFEELQARGFDVASELAQLKSLFKEDIPPIKALPPGEIAL